MRRSLPFRLYSHTSYGPNVSSFNSKFFLAVSMPTSSLISSWRTLYVRSRAFSGSKSPAECSKSISELFALTAASLVCLSRERRFARSFLSRTDYQIEIQLAWFLIILNVKKLHTSAWHVKNTLLGCSYLEPNFVASTICRYRISGVLSFCKSVWIYNSNFIRFRFGFDFRRIHCGHSGGWRTRG